MLKYITMVLILAGCQTTRPELPTSCVNVIKAELKGCAPIGQQHIADEDGLGIAIFALCAVDTASPVARAIIITDGPARLDQARSVGARDAGECSHGTNIRSVVVLDKAAPDMRASK